MALLTLENITVKYKGKCTLENINLKINENDVFGLIGRNGSGKTTILKVISGLIKPNFGRILMDGKEINPKSQTFKKNIGYATQESSLFDQLTVKNNLKYFGYLYNVKGNINKKAEDIAENLSLGDKISRRVNTLSGGMKRRLNIGCALMHDPLILLLDEPTIELDPVARKDIWSFSKRLNRGGTTIIIASNILADITALCNRAAYIEGGRIAYEGQPKGVIKQMNL